MGYRLANLHKLLVLHQLLVVALLYLEVLPLVESILELDAQTLAPFKLGVLYLYPD